MTRFEGKVAVVTGAGAGMGRATALRLAGEGATVVACDVSGAQDDTAAELPERIEARRVDVTSSADLRDLVAGVVADHGGLDVLCNVVGVAGVAQGLLPDVDEDEFDQLIAINLKSCFLGMKHAIPAMVERGGGAIVNWSSTGGIIASKTTGPYGSSKAGVLSLTRTAAREWGASNIRVNAICPGFVYPTGMTLMGEERYPELVERTAQKSALERPGHPDEIASVAAFLASDDASYVTGAQLVVDGGWTAGD